MGHFLQQGGDDKNLGGESSLGVQIKVNRFNFLTHKYIFQ